MCCKPPGLPWLYMPHEEHVFGTGNRHIAKLCFPHAFKQQLDKSAATLTKRRTKGKVVNFPPPLRCRVRRKESQQPPSGAESTHFQRTAADCPRECGSTHDHGATNATRRRSISSNNSDADSGTFCLHHLAQIGKPFPCHNAVSSFAMTRRTAASTRSGVAGAFNCG